MFIYKNGDILKSEAQALINTVNCEGYMGKGLAYQFKQVYPEMNRDYIKACKTGKLKIGKLHYYSYGEKIIINFPTKNKWRERSLIDYIYIGLDELIKLVKQLDIKSVAIPPLGSGNGGLNWNEVKKVIETSLQNLSNKIDIYIYEPSNNYAVKIVSEPKLYVSALVLMQLKLNLTKFNKIRLQKTAYFMNIFAGLKYFNFSKDKYGPFDYTIDIISKNIREFQKYHNVKDTQEAYNILYNKIVSENTIMKLSKLSEAIKKATDFVNKFENTYDVEGVATTLFIIENAPDLSEHEIISSFKGWSKDKADRFTEVQIKNYIQILVDNNIINKNLIGYNII